MDCRVKPGNDSTETHCLTFVMPGLVPGIHVLLLEEEAVLAQLQIFSTTQPP